MYMDINIFCSICPQYILQYLEIGQIVAFWGERIFFEFDIGHIVPCDPVAVATD